MHLTLQPAPTQQPQIFHPVQTPTIWDNMSDALHDSFLRVLNLMIGILPGLLTLLLAVVVMAAIGWFLSFIVRRILISVRFDDRLAANQSNGIADWSPGHSPTLLAGRTVFWGCVLFGLILGVSALSAFIATDSGTPYFFLPYLTRSIGAILLLVAGNLIARFLARSILIGAVNQKLQYARFLSLGVKWLVLVLTAAMVLDHLQIGGTVIELAFGILFGGIVLTLSLAIGLGSRDLVSRSIEKSIDLSDPIASHTRPHPTETYRHF